MSNSRIIGIDVGTALSGWAVMDRVDGMRGKLIEYGTITMVNKYTDAAR